jgi:predicted PurR-regulated permease PerM
VGTAESGTQRVASPASPRRRRWPLVAVLVLSFVGAAVIAEPLWIALVIGAVMAVSAQHPYRALTLKLGGRTRLAAALVTIGAGILLTVAGSFVIAALTNEFVRLVALLDRYAKEQGSAGLGHLLGPTLSRVLARLGVDTASITTRTQSVLESAAAFIASGAGVALRTTSHALLDLVVALLTMYYALREGPSLALRIEGIAPLEPRHTRALIHEAREVGRTAFLGSIATALVQGSIAGLGYIVLDVPQPVTWALATAVASFVPVFGTLLVWIPIAVYLFMAGHTARAILLACWGVLAVTLLSDYVIRPRIVGRKGHSHPLLTLISLLGGIEVFGLVGLVIAPIVMSLFVAALRLYEREIGPPAVIPVAS